MIKQCNNCCYYRRGLVSSICIRFPPVPVQKLSGIFKIETEFEFPTVRNTDICGEWHTNEIDWSTFPPRDTKDES